MGRNGHLQRVEGMHVTKEIDMLKNDQKDQQKYSFKKKAILHSSLICY